MKLLPASFRGCPFAVRGDTLGGGRRLAEHEYPGRDGLFPEDMGRAGRRYRLQGFLVAGGVYGGGAIDVQRQAFIAAVELPGPAPLVHPTLGAILVSCRGYTVSNDLGAATAAEVELELVEYTAQIFPLLSAATTQVVAIAALAADVAASTSFGASGSSGAPAAAAAMTWSAAVVAGGQDATALVNLAAQLPGPFGRYGAGANSGYLSSASSYSGDTTVDELVADAASARAAIGAAAGVVAADFGALTAPSAPQAGADVQALVAALLAACADPSDGLRLMSALAASTPTGVTAVDDLFRRAAVVAATRASAAYQPSSQTDAQNVQARVTGLLDQEIEIAGDEGDDGSFQALKTLRQAVVSDLQARGGALSPLVTVQIAVNLPALSLAEQLYGDASRADQLVSEAAPINPLFMPNTFQALAA